MGRIYFRNLVKATALLVIILPYVLMTNFTATRMQVALHALLFWFFAPICITTTMALLKKIRTSFLSSELSFNLTSHFMALSLSSALMIVTFHEVTAIPYNVVLSPYLWAALLPIFVSYSLIDLYNAWKNQKTRSLELESARSKSAWKALSAQIKPHFLFNTLNMIEHLVISDPSLAQKCIQNLAELYRAILRTSRQDLVSLGTEMDTVGKYLDIQSLRLGARLTPKIQIDELALSYKIPANVILSCVENAIKHGIEPSLDAGILRIDIKCDRQFITIEIENPIPLAPAKSRGEGFGLDYIKGQLELIYSEKSKFTQTRTLNTFITRINLPTEDPN